MQGRVTWKGALKWNGKACESNGGGVDIDGTCHLAEEVWSGEHGVHIYKKPGRGESEFGGCRAIKRVSFTSNYLTLICQSGSVLLLQRVTQSEAIICQSNASSTVLKKYKSKQMLVCN